MIRRLARFILAALCLLSLLVAAGVACVWWAMSSGGQGYVADASILGTYVVVELLPESQVGGLVARVWPGPPTIGVWSRFAYYSEHPIEFTAPRLRPWRHFRLSGQSGQISVYVRTNTSEPVRWDPGPARMPPKSMVVAHGPMSVWTLGEIPPWLVASAAPRG